MPVVANRRPAERVAAVRRFNRFYTQRIGVLRGGWLDSAFSLTEARVLYEIGQRDAATASDIGRELGLDAGYLSRMLRGFHKRGLIRKQASPRDARQTLLAMTAAGRKAFAPLEAKTKQQVAAMLRPIAIPAQDRLVSAMRTIETLLEAKPAARADVVLREPRPGDFGTIVARHGILYAQEYGWAENFEGLCAQIVADFVNSYDAAARALLDRRGRRPLRRLGDAGEGYRRRRAAAPPAGRAVCARARHRRRLTDECIRFARSCGYRRITLWTHGVLTAARHIYERAGFRLTSSEKKRSFGQDVVSEHWDLTL